MASAAFAFAFAFATLAFIAAAGPGCMTPPARTPAPAVAVAIAAASTPAPAPAAKPPAQPSGAVPSASAPDAGAPSLFAKDSNPSSDPSVVGELGYVTGPDGGVAAPSAACKDPDAGPPCQRGSIDKEIIRRIIRRHLDDVRGCYEPELAGHAGLGGRIMVRFTIASDGDVIASALQSSTMDNATVENCIVDAVRRWQFPRLLHGGLMTVSYPFVITPAGAPRPPR